jgi:hypothetical protein
MFVLFGDLIREFMMVVTKILMKERGEYIPPYPFLHVERFVGLSTDSYCASCNGGALRCVVTALLKNEGGSRKWTGATAAFVFFSRNN